MSFAWEINELARIRSRQENSVENVGQISDRTSMDKFGDPWIG